MNKKKNKKLCSVFFKSFILAYDWTIHAARMENSRPPFTSFTANCAAVIYGVGRSIFERILKKRLCEIEVSSL